MKKITFILLSGVLIAFVSCSNRESTSGTADSTSPDSVSQDVSNTDGALGATGDFDGDGVQETGTITLAQEGSGMYSAIFTIGFSKTSLPAFRFETDTDERLLINEGDLNSVPGDELTIYTRATTIDAGFNLESYTFSNGAWALLMENISYPANAPGSPGPDKLIFRKNDKVYFLKYSGEGISGFQESPASLYSPLTPLTEPFLDKEIVAHGDFDGDESEELVRVVPLGDVDSATPTKYRIEFSSLNSPLEVASFRDGFEVFTEGNLDGVPGSELSVMTSGDGGDYTVITTYSHNEDGWKAILSGIKTRDILPSGLNREDLIFEKEGSAYYLDDASVGEFGTTGDKSKLKEIKVELKK